MQSTGQHILATHLAAAPPLPRPTPALRLNSRLPLALDTPLTYMKGVGPARAVMLQSRGLETVEDLLHYFPFRYEDRSNLKPISQLAPGAGWLRSISSATRR